MTLLALSAPSTLDGAGSEAQHVAALWWWMLAAAVAVYLLVGGFVVAALVRRRDDGPEKQHFVWIGGLALPIVVLGALAFATVAVTVGLRRTTSNELTVQVVGHDWWWEVKYADSDLVSADEIHLPVNRTAALRLQSDDVVHSFWVPQLAGKLDVIPGQTNVLRLTPKREGTFIGECAEFCGVQHANMRFLVVVQSERDYDDWVRSRATLASAVSGADVFQREACAGCHTIRGTQATGRIGPELSDFGRRRWIGAGVAPNTPDNLLRWIRDPDVMKPGVIMPGFEYLSDADLHALVAYLESLR